VIFFQPEPKLSKTVLFLTIQFKFSEKMAPQPGRLYAKGLFTGFKRGLRNQHENTALVKVEGCEGKGDAEWYVGKRCAYVYKVRQIMIILKFLNC
jgi:large subunit ribosomal protein L35Ae